MQHSKPKSRTLDRLRKSLNEIPGLKMLPARTQEFEKWQRNARVAVAKAFGEESENLADFKGILYSPTMYIGGVSTNPQPSYLRGLSRAEAMLESMIEEVEEYWEENEPTSVLSRNTETHRSTTPDVFVIHGTDDGTKNTVARFLEQLELNAIILADESNQGRTIIEKFEQHANAAFAVALLTPDDSGSIRGQEEITKARARQNVIFELGFFIGKLGRRRVCALTKGEIEIPSDYSGVLYVPIDESGAWKLSLVRELKAAGLAVDANLAV